MSKPHADAREATPLARCGARLKRTPGKTCSKAAGWRTDHPGQGKCYLHGGATPIKSGLYSQIKRPTFVEKIERFRTVADPLDLTDEVALLRAFVEDFVERWDSIYGADGALLAWHESFQMKISGEGQVLTPAPKPRQMPDFSAITDIVDKVGRMVERVNKLKQEQSVSLAMVDRLMQQMAVELVGAIQEVGLASDQSTKLLEVFERRWHAIKLDTGRGGFARA